MTGVFFILCLSFLIIVWALAFGLVKRIPSDVLKKFPSGSFDAGKRPLCHLRVALTKHVWTSLLNWIVFTPVVPFAWASENKKAILMCVWNQKQHQGSLKMLVCLFSKRFTVQVPNVNTSRRAMENISKYLLFMGVWNRCWHLIASVSSWLKSQAQQNEPKRYSPDWCSYSAEFSCVFNLYEHFL